jgi:cytochrome c oxidase assembly protein Cox11
MGKYAFIGLYATFCSFLVGSDGREKKSKKSYRVSPIQVVLKIEVTKKVK